MADVQGGRESETIFTSFTITTRQFSLINRMSTYWVLLFGIPLGAKKALDDS